MTDLRTLAQAVVDAWEARHRGRERPTGVQDAYDILAALNAERNAADAQGYARAMVEVATEADRRGDESERHGRPWAAPYHLMGEWARERAAAAEKEREG